MTKPRHSRKVIFEPLDGPINNLVDEAYRTKYKDSPYLDPTIVSRACSPFLIIIGLLSLFYLVFGTALSATALLLLARTRTTEA